MKLQYPYQVIVEADSIIEARRIFIEAHKNGKTFVVVSDEDLADYAFFTVTGGAYEYEEGIEFHGDIWIPERSDDDEDL
jgi:hypothetical protein